LGRVESRFCSFRWVGLGWVDYDPHRIDTHELTATKFRAVDYVNERTPETKFGTNLSTGGFWANG